MSVNLQKGQKVDLTKGNSGLKKIMVGLGWDEADKPSGGFLSGLFSKAPQDIDCDASAILCQAGGKLSGSIIDPTTKKPNKDIVYFGNLIHESNSVKHMGDNLTGSGDGDDEQIFIDLKSIPGQYEKVVFVVNIYKAFERNQHFGMIKNAFIRIVDGDTNKELCKYNLSENYDGKTAMIFGEVYKHQDEWKFNAVGEATTDKGLLDTANRYI